MDRHTKIDLGKYPVTLDCDCEVNFVDPPADGEYAWCDNHGDTTVYEAHDREILNEYFDSQTFDEVDISRAGNIYHLFCVCWKPQHGSWTWFTLDKENNDYYHEGEDVDGFCTSQEAWENAKYTLELRTLEQGEMVYI